MPARKKQTKLWFTEPHKRWTNEEEIDLALLYQNHTATEVARKLHRSLYSVQAKLSALRISKVEQSDIFVSNQPCEDPKSHSRKTWFAKFLDFFRG